MRKKLCCPVILSILFILQSCQKQTSINKEESCYHTKENVISDSTVYGLTYHYDELNRLIFVDRPMVRDDSISYQTDKITVYNIPGANEWYVVFYLNNKSLAASCEIYLDGILNTKRYFTYTSDDYLATMRDSSKSGIVDYSLSYTNGNLTEFEMRLDTSVAITRLEYYPNEVKFWTYLHNYYFVGNAVYYPWLGKHSKSLPKSIRFEKGTGFDTRYTYELDEKGYIRKRTRILESFNASTDAFMEHECR
ncbi:MAG: DUF4595 domain-containing protein [Flavihumibacter sp.]|nr:DUF4595 domain-containing protein [Flavihumibacter sp.]